MSAKPPRRPNYEDSSRFPDETPRFNAEKFMGSLGDVGPLSDWEWADLNNRVDRFHENWKPNGSVGLERFLPPVGARHRLHVLVELIKTDMGRRAEQGIPFQVESYLGQFRTDLPHEVVPVSLLVEEYQLRHEFADKPSREDFRRRFPQQFAAFERELDGGPQLPVPKPQRGGTIGPESDPSKPPPAPAAPPTVQEGSPPTPKPRPGTRPDGRMVPPTTPKPPSRPVPSTAPAPGPRLSGGSEPPLFPEIGNGYSIVRFIDKGAFGRVYEAEAEGGIRVAVKCVDPPSAHAGGRSAFQSELTSLETWRTLSHVYLLNLQRFWVTTDNRLVVVMDLADGTLMNRIELFNAQRVPGAAPCVPPEELIPFMEQAAQALDYLHSQNISHRDVKPQNLLRLKDAAQVADMGLAREHDSGETVFIGGRCGTPHYMAPEAWRKQMSLKKSDQYSLAATYVHARLGRPLFTGDVIELQEKHLKETPNLDPLPAAEQAVLLKALSKSTKDRYPSCVAFLKALDEAVFPPPPPPPSAMQSTLQDPQTISPPTIPSWLLLTVAVLLCGLVVGGIAVVKMWFDRPTGNGNPTTTERIIEQPLRKPWCPLGWRPGSHDPDTFEQYDGRWFAPTLTREVGGETLVAVLIKPHRQGERVFYMTKNKISNRVFQSEWELAVRNPESTLNKVAGLAGREDLLVGAWRSGAYGLDLIPLGIANEQAKLPVVGVTTIEAMIVARELGGMLPTYAQWLKAVGATGDGSAPGPTGEQPKGTDDEIRAEFARRGLALGLRKGPSPVTDPTSDRSYWEIHQLLSNGQEWLDEREGGGRLMLAVAPSKDTRVAVVGQQWASLEVTTFRDLRDRPAMLAIDDTKAAIGFRIVLEP